MNGVNNRDRDRSYDYPTQMSAPRRSFGHNSSLENTNPPPTHAPSPRMKSQGRGPRNSQSFNNRHGSRDIRKPVQQDTTKQQPQENTTSSDVPAKGKGGFVEIETDENILSKRFAEIQAVKQTPAYEIYSLTVPLNTRNYDLRYANHPQTPKHIHKMSSRRWKGYLTQWRSLLHGWDDGNTGFSSLEDMKLSRLERHTNCTDQSPIQNLNQNDGRNTTNLNASCDVDQNIALHDQNQLQHTENTDSDDEALEEAMKMAQSILNIS